MSISFIKKGLKIFLIVLLFFIIVVTYLFYLILTDDAGFAPTGGIESLYTNNKYGFQIKVLSGEAILKKIDIKPIPEFDGEIFTFLKEGAANEPRFRMIIIDSHNIKKFQERCALPAVNQPSFCPQMLDKEGKSYEIDILGTNYGKTFIWYPATSFERHVRASFIITN